MRVSHTVNRLTLEVRVIVDLEVSELRHVSALLRDDAWHDQRHDERET